MKKLFMAIISVAVLATGSMPAVWAQQNGNTNSNQGNPPSAVLEKLKEKHQDRIERVIGQSKKTKIQQNCNGLQNSLKNVSQKASSLNQIRGNSFDQILARLDRFVLRIEAAELDSTGLKAAIDELKLAADSIDEAKDAYKAAVLEVVEADCQDTENAQAFHEALETVRIAREELRAQIAEAKQVIRQELKNALTEIKDQLNSGDDTDETEETEETEAGADETNEAEQNEEN